MAVGNNACRWHVKRLYNCISLASFGLRVGSLEFNKIAPPKYEICSKVLRNPTSEVRVYIPLKQGLRLTRRMRAGAGGLSEFIFN